MNNSKAELESKLAIEATEALIKYLEVQILIACTHYQLLSDETNFGSYKLKRYHLKQYMRLDASVLDALNLVPNKGDSISFTRKRSFFSWLPSKQNIESLRTPESLRNFDGL